MQGDKNQYLQLDLGKPVLIYAVGSQGSHLSDNWVLKYMVRYSDDGRSWKFYSQVRGAQSGLSKRMNPHRYVGVPIRLK